jgi:hypothetical protein
MTLIKDSPDEYQRILDEVAKEHIDSFWNVYDLILGFDIEHKINNSGYTAVTNPFGKVDYIILNLWGKEVIKIRGVSPKDYSIHPKVEMLRALMEERECTFYFSNLVNLIGVNEFIKKPSNYSPKLPGMEIEEPYLLKPKRHGNLLFDTYTEFNRKEKAFKERVRSYNYKYSDVPIALRPQFLN